jgi:hypothetical protein
MWKVTLTVQDSTGSIDSISQFVVFNIAPRFTFQPKTPIVEQPVTFNASTSTAFPPSALSFGWTFGDGSIGSGVVAAHSYAASGFYRISLTLITTALGNPSISKTILVSLPPPGAIIFSKALTFDGVTATVFAAFTVDTKAGMLTGTVTVIAVDSTSGAIIFSKTFNVNLTFGTISGARFVVSIPALTLKLAVGCGINVAGASSTCIFSRTPDINGDGSINIADFVSLVSSLGTLSGMPGYNPAADLNADGKVDIADIVILIGDLGVPFLT